MALPTSDDIVAVMSMFPEAVLNADGSATVSQGGIDICVTALGSGGVALVVSSPPWPRKTTQANNATLVRKFGTEGTAVSDPLEAILWSFNEWADGAHTGTRDDNSKAGPTEALPSCEHRRWLWFIGFYTPSIREAFVAEANSRGLTGFLMPGKPAVAVLEGDRSAIDGFLTTTRTALFARVPPASRKMTVTLEEGASSVQASPSCLCDSAADGGSGAAPGSPGRVCCACAAPPRLRRAFATFSEEGLVCEPGTHQRGDITDIGALRRFLDARGLRHVRLDDILL